MENKNERFVFWNGQGQIIAHLLYQFFASQGIGNYFPQYANKKNSDPLLVKRDGNRVGHVNVGYLLDVTRLHILESAEDPGAILNSLHAKTGLFGDKNLKLLPTLKLEFISDTADFGYSFFQDCIVRITKDEIQICDYDDFKECVWENSIIPLNFKPVDHSELEHDCDFMQFLHDLTIVEDEAKAAERFNALRSAIGYLLHRYKNPSTTKAIILMDIYVNNGFPNGGGGKTLIINAIGKVVNLSIIDGKKWDNSEWFGLSSVELNTEVLLFDDIVKNFDFQLIFPLITTGMFIRRKYKDHVFIPFDKSPKVAITTNYSINGNSSSFLRRMYEFEISATYSADYSPRDKFNKNFFDEWTDYQWNLFYNTMFGCLQVFLKNGLIESEPININLTKLIQKTGEEFYDWSEIKLLSSIQYDKKILYDDFVKAYPEFSGKLKQRDFTYWLRAWGEFKNLSVLESHSGDIRNIQFATKLVV